jgi:ABC-type antimicrobial peptide transport system permease subunit
LPQHSGRSTRISAVPTVVANGLEAYLGGKRRLAVLLGPLALLALVLSVIGVYGTTAFVVSQRTAELGVRMAMGATASDVTRLFLKDGMRPIAIGIVVGLAAALAAGRVAAQELAGISPHDPLSIATAVFVLVVSAVLAVVVPARRSARIDPATVLRQS